LTGDEHHLDNWGLHCARRKLGGDTSMSRNLLFFLEKLNGSFGIVPKLGRNSGGN
jgi:hypothetical protein